MAVKLVFSTQDPDEIEFATRYWAIGEDGEYLEKVGDLVPFRDITHPSMVAKFLRSYCQAYDENLLCAVCDHLMPMSSRTKPNKLKGRSQKPCSECAQDIAVLEQEKAAADEQELQRILSERVDRFESISISYDDLQDDVCLILQAIESLTSNSLAEYPFTEKDCRQLSPTGAERYIRRLRAEGILLDDPRSARKGLYYLKNGELFATLDELPLRLPRDVDYGAGSEAFSIIEGRVFSDFESLSQLWLDYAADDIIQYFSYRAEFFSFDLDPQVLELIREAFRVGLKTYSVSQLWYIAWVVTKDASSLANHKFFNHSKAFASIPNKIRKSLEYAESNGGIERTWHRSEYHITGALGMMFFKHFGINEYTTGKTVFQGFRRLNAGPDDEAAGNLEELALNWLERSLARNNTMATLEQFASLVRKGLDTEQAVRFLICQEMDDESNEP